MPGETIQVRGDGAGTGRLVLDGEGFARFERLVAYELGNTLLILHLELQRSFGLRVEEYQIFLQIVLSTEQRIVRDPDADDGLMDRRPLPSAAAGSSSRRRISEALGLPLETVRRTVAGLFARVMIVERRRGCLSTPGGTLERLAAAGIPERMVRRFLAVSNARKRLGVARPRSIAGTPVTADAAACAGAPDPERRTDLRSGKGADPGPRGA